LGFVETDMNGRSHPNHENRQKNVKITMVPRIRASSRHGGAVRFSFNRSGKKISEKSTVLIRRGGAPSGAAGSIIIGGMGVSTPIINSGIKRFS
jgi:hypothetical protein